MHPCFALAEASSLPHPQPVLYSYPYSPCSRPLHSSLLFSSYHRPHPSPFLRSSCAFGKTSNCRRHSFIAAPSDQLPFFSSLIASLSTPCRHLQRLSNHRASKQHYTAHPENRSTAFNGILLPPDQGVASVNMRSTSIIALSSFLALVSATPLAKRAMVIKTKTVTEEFTMTVDTTTTVWVEPTKAAVAPQENYQQPPQKHGHMHQHHHSHVAAGPVNHAPAAVTSKPIQAPAPVLPTPKAPAYVPAPQAPKEPAPVPAPVVEAPKTPAAPAYTPPKQLSPPAYQPAPSPVPAPAPAPVPVPAPAPKPAPSPSQGSSADSGLSGGSCGTIGGKCSGDITYYQVGLGACGWTNDGSSEDVFALAHGMPNLLIRIKGHVD